MLTSCNYFVDYVDAILLDERGALTVDIIYEFLTAFFSKVRTKTHFCFYIKIIYYYRLLHMYYPNKR